MTFTGTGAGADSSWVETSTLVATAVPLVRVLTVDRTGNVTDPAHEIAAVADGASYDQVADGNCVAAVAEPAASAALEPAAGLPSVIGADAAGSATVGDVAVDQYTFDEQALGLAGISTATGSIAIAATGGYVLSDTVTSTGAQDLFGEGVTGTLQIDYVLSAIGTTTATLPAACPPGLVQIAPTADATNVDSEPGLLSFDTPTPVADVASFYAGAIPQSGWVPIEDADVQDDSTEMDFTRGTQVLNVTIGIGDTGTEVDMTLAPIQPDAT